MEKRKESQATGRKRRQGGSKAAGKKGRHGMEKRKARRAAGRKRKPGVEKHKEILLYPLITEKAVDMIERDNKLTFIVGIKATKKEISGQVEKEFKVKVDRVNVVNDMKGRKKAIVQVNKEFKANDIAMKLGVI